MTITLTVDEQKEIAERTASDPRVITRFFEALATHRSRVRDDVLACRLAVQE